MTTDADGVGLRPLVVETTLVTLGFALALAIPEQNVAGLVIALAYGVRLVVFADRAQRACFFGFGAIWTAADLAFVHAGVFAYSSPQPWGAPSFMPLLFGQLALLARAMVTLLPRPRERVPPLVDQLTIAAATIAALALFDRAASALAVGLVALFLVRAAVSGFEVAGLVTAAVFGIGEPLLEALLIHLGLFEFTAPRVLGLPLWYSPYFAASSYPIARAFMAFASPSSGSRASKADRP